jgi:integrase
LKTNPKDRRLKKRASSANWYYQRTVPKALQDQLGSKVIVESLGTSDLRDARLLRDIKDNEWELKFSIARERTTSTDSPLSASAHVKSSASLRANHKAQVTLLALKNGLNWIMDDDNSANGRISADEIENIEAGLSDMVETTLRYEAEHIPLSTQRSIRDINALLKTKMYNPLDFDAQKAREVISTRPDPKKQSLSTLRDMFLKEKQAEKLALKTQRGHDTHLKALEGTGWDAYQLRIALQAQEKADSTVYNYLKDVRTFSKWLSKHGVEFDMPDISKPRRTSTRATFTSDELQAIESQPMDETAYWITMICMHHGFRQGEPLQLGYQDVREIHGFWCFDIHERTQGKTLKNAATTRCLPIHPWLVSKGFLDYWHAHKGWARVWKSYDGTASQKFSQHINSVIRDALCLQTSTTETGKKVFHSLRHTFRDYCREAEIPEGVANRLGGWSRGGGEGDNYGAGESLKKSHEYLSRLKFIKS